ncbi:MAG: bifunctional 5,10-methylenetetrahydrofolate dehydrogenase/5,10-methenyltetrahydrofolate cyclohydrolase [Turneriella sp.]|nr:bifunctional 5,10-methylenetetrahydrofolate dehydrogenase/5,10-methenyltetrahydrofolate cyclohydrolase [Turneriella sp.]
MSVLSTLPPWDFDTNTWVEGKRLWGKKLAQLLREKIAEHAQKLPVRPGLAAILVGDDPASAIYVRSKEKAAREAGLHSELVHLKAEATQEEVVSHIHRFNLDSAIHAILVQLPLPAHLNTSTILQAIVPEKDADGFHYSNSGRLFAGVPATLPCTPAGVALMLRELVREKKIELRGKHAVVVGRSNIVGKPMAQLLLSGFDMTVTICHSRTRNLADFIHGADLLISATGVRGAVDLATLKEGAIVVDVGIHRDGEKLTGDLDLSIAEKRAAFYTPVPGGVGPMTIAMLLFNTLRHAQEKCAITIAHG